LPVAGEVTENAEESIHVIGNCGGWDGPGMGDEKEKEASSIAWRGVSESAALGAEAAAGARQDEESL